ncbi:hypothetical protein ACET3Z_007741 [Daucus carota]
MAMRNFYKEIKGLKVKDLPAHMKPMFTIDYLKGSVKRGLDSYHAKYIQTSSVDPVYHVCFGGILSIRSTPRKAINCLIELQENKDLVHCFP